MRKAKRIISILVTLAFVLVMFTGCGKGTEGDKASSGDVTKEKVPQVYKIATEKDPDTFNVLFSAVGDDATLWKFINAGLLQFDKDGNLIPYVAKEMPTISDDKKTVTFKLREGVKWHDGVELTSEDVKYTYELLRDNKLVMVNQMPTLDKVNCPDKYTVEFKLKNVDSGILYTFSSPILLPKHIWEKEDQNNLNKSEVLAAQKNMGCGPFKLSNYVRGEKITLVKNPDFFLDVKLDKVEISITGSSETALMKFQKGEIDFLEIPMTSANAVKAMKDITLREIYQVQTYDVVYNLKSQIFSDKKVRQAIAYGFDKKAMIDGLLYGYGTPADTTFPRSMNCYNPETDKYKFNIDTAKQMLDEAGWKVGADGIRVKDGKPFKVEILGPTGSQTSEQFCTIIKSQLKNLGIEVTIKILDGNTMFSQVTSGAYDFAIWALPFDYPGYDQRILYSSDPGLGVYNIEKYNNPEIDKLYKQLEQTFDTEQQKQILGDIQNILAEDLPIFAILSTPGIVAFKKNLEPQYFTNVTQVATYNIEFK